MATCDERDLVSLESLRSPRLVVEVLSPGTEKHDKGQKFDWYWACPSIQEIVFIRTAHPLVEVYRRQSAVRQWLLQIYGPGEVVELTSLNVGIPVDVIYRRVIFAHDITEENLQ